MPLLPAVLLQVGCATLAEGNRYRQISVTDVAVMMEEEPGYIILDVRTPADFYILSVSVMSSQKALRRLAIIKTQEVL